MSREAARTTTKSKMELSAMSLKDIINPCNCLLKKANLKISKTSNK